MNAKGTFTTSSRQTLITLIIAALLALSVTIAQSNLSAWTGIGSASVAHACQGSGGTGGC